MLISSAKLVNTALRNLQQPKEPQQPGHGTGGVVLRNQFFRVSNDPSFAELISILLISIPVFCRRGRAIGS